MGWVTVYIRGKSGFKSEVLNQLHQSDFKFMQGFANEKGVALYWIDDDDQIRSFKKAIGSKTIFKFRLKFYMTVEEFVETRFNGSPKLEQWELN
ncbi:MAG: hypothetical protein ABIS36_25705 [Chryseolinea sp.]